MEFQSIDVPSQQRWAEMVHKHATVLEEQLWELQGQIVRISSSAMETLEPRSQPIQIENPTQFNRAASEILHQTQDLNNDVGRLFTSSASAEKQPAQDALIEMAMKAVPLRLAEEITRFSVQLQDAGRSEAVDRKDSRNDRTVPTQPR
jgi:hypothetical protein